MEIAKTILSVFHSFKRFHRHSQQTKIALLQLLIHQEEYCNYVENPAILRCKGGETELLDLGQGYADFEDHESRA